MRIPRVGRQLLYCDRWANFQPAMGWRVGVSSTEGWKWTLSWSEDSFRVWNGKGEHWFADFERGKMLAGETVYDRPSAMYIKDFRRDFNENS